MGIVLLFWYWVTDGFEGNGYMYIVQISNVLLWERAEGMNFISFSLLLEIKT